VKKEQKGLLAVISGPSGVGKSTVMAKLLKMCPEITVSVSATTRPKRPFEKDKEDYFFYSEEKFFDLQKKGEFLEWAKVHGYYYGTPRGPIEKALEKGRTIILEVDVQGAASIKELVSRKKVVSASEVFVFLIPPSVDILAFRLKKRRTEKAEEQNYRLRSAIAELQVMEKYDYIVVNDDIESAAEKIKAIINVEKERMMLN
jgi:guanylate kinase